MLGALSRVGERRGLIGYVNQVAVRCDTERGESARGKRRAGDRHELVSFALQHGNRLAARIDGNHKSTVGADSALLVDIAAGETFAAQRDGAPAGVSEPLSRRLSTTKPFCCGSLLMV